MIMENGEQTRQLVANTRSALSRLAGVADVVLPTYGGTLCALIMELRMTEGQLVGRPTM